MTFWAHSGTSADRSDWQNLTAHLHGVERLAEGMGRPLGIGRSVALAGLLHDLGKYDPAFDARLRGEAVRVDHSTAGAAALLALATEADDRMVAELLAYAILGHHAGLPDRRGSGEGTLDARIESFDMGRLDEAWRSDISIGFDKIPQECVLRATGPYPGFDLSVAVRMILSCLVDADFKDTEAFYARIEGRHVDRVWPSLQDLRPELVDRFDAYVAGKPSDGEVNALRGEVLSHVRAHAAMPSGLFTLTVPTGGGKTLASLGFALDHAAQGHRRIIYAIPFTSVIDQTAAIFRDVLGEGIVLEHHSAIDEARDRPGGRGPSGRDKLRLAMEDWAAPVVVTTNVQLFESLFAARPSRARKLHNIAGSVIVLDEAQTIPRNLLMPCVRMLDALSRHWGCSIVLCTATQPALDEAKLPGGLPLQGRELAPDPAGLARRLRRATIRWGGAMDDGVLVGALRDSPQALVVVNSRGHALALYRAAKDAGLEGLVHLSTRRCAVDRRDVIADVRGRLARGMPCRVISTSLIEAGVDVDFPRVWRAKAGLDQVVQAAGRCNREGRRAAEDSLVTVFDAPDWPPPAEIASLIGDAERMIAGHEDLLGTKAMEAYFREVFWRMGDRLDARRILPRLTVGRQGTDFAFRSVAEDFRMIESGMVPVIVPFDATARKALEDLKNPRIPSSALARALQGYVVQVPPRAREALVRNGRVTFAAPGLRGDQFAELTDMELYDGEVGLIWEDSDAISIEDLIV